MSALDRFHEEMGSLNGPMVVVTATDGIRSAGCLVGFHTQVSVDPARYLVCLSNKNHTFEVASSATHFAVHFLRSDQLDVAGRFGEQCSEVVDKFASMNIDEGPAGTIVLHDCASWFVGSIVGRIALDDHVAFGLEPIASGGAKYDGALLGFQEAKHLRAAHGP